MKILLEDRKNWNEQFRPYAKVLHHSFEEENLYDYFAIGSFFFVLKSAKYGTIGYCDKPFLTWSNYAPAFGNELLNSNYIILPACELSRLKFDILGQFAVDCKIFVRPNAANKVFDGQILDITEIDYISSLWGNELTVISSPKDILGEWRFVVEKSGEILGYSLYRYQGDFVTFPSAPPEMLDYVKEMAKIAKWSDPVVTMDIAQLTTKKFKVIECNALSTSGLYACKPEKIVEYIEKL